MRRQLLLVLCLLAILGNVFLVMLPASTVARFDPALATLELNRCIVGLLSIWCALLLRKRIVESIRVDSRYHEGAGVSKKTTLGNGS